MKFKETETLEPKKSTSKKYLSVLQEKELLKRLGPDKGGHWKATDEK